MAGRSALTTCAVALAALAAVASADAKLGCGPVERLSNVSLAGLPSQALAGQAYTVTADLPRSHAVNPKPMLLTARCQGKVDGHGAAPVPGIDNGAGAYTFDVRFAQPGRWRIVAMDQSGQFHDFGFLDVVSAVVEPAGEDEVGALPGIAIAIGAICGGAAAVVVRRRRS